MENVEELRRVKRELGELVWLDYSNDDLPTGHYYLGKHVSRQVHKILKRRLDDQTPERTQRAFAQVRACRTALDSKMADEAIARPIRSAIREYITCLEAWEEGVGLAGFSHPAMVNLGKLAAIDLAFFLQHDNSGCQTGMYREADSGVILWHTEEDIEREPGSCYDQIRIASFNVGKSSSPTRMAGFIYPDLLPGPSFGWRTDGYAQAADLLYVKQSPALSTGVLANIVTWLTLRLGPLYPAMEVIQAMLPCFDGYAINTVQLNGEVVKARKYELGADLVIPHELDELQGSFLYQANIFTNGNDERVKEIEATLPGRRKWFERRVDNTSMALNNMPDHPSADRRMLFFHGLLCSQSAGGGSYANKDVKAYFIYRQTKQGAEIWLHHGPALADDNVKIINIPS